MLDAISSGIRQAINLMTLYQDDLLFYTGQHLILVAISMALALVPGLMAGIVLSRPSMRRYGETGMQVFNVFNAIPPMAALAVALTVFGIGAVPTIVALWMASMMPIARGVYQGLRSISPSMCEAAKGLGLTPLQQLWRVELPNAVPTIMGGVRTALALNIGSVPLSYYIGANSLGSLIGMGVSNNNQGQLFVGVVATSLLALVLDGAVALLTRGIASRGVLMESKASV